jgi:hypothetical protein
MATTNAQQFNPAQNNQLTDTAYATDSTRVNGAGVDAIWPSNTSNKTLYQVSTYVTALGQMMANKGFTNSDANLAALTTVMSNILMSSDLPTPLQLVPFSPSVVLNAAIFTGFEIALAGNMNIFIVGLKPGQLITMMYVQDSVGGRTVNVQTNAGVGFFLQPDPTPNIASVQVLVPDAGGNFLHSVTPMISSLNGGIVGTPIGSTLPSTGKFTNLAATTAAVSGAVTAASVAVSGAVSASSVAVSGSLSAASATLTGTLFAPGIDAAGGVVDTGTLNVSGNAGVGGQVNANTVSANGAAFASLTAQTVSPSDNGLNVANTAWAKFGLTISIGATGFIRLPAWMGSITFQWGQVGPGSGAIAVFPLTFPANLFGIHLTPIFNNATDTNTRYVQVNVNPNLAEFELIVSNGATATVCYYLAIGN